MDLVVHKHEGGFFGVSLSLSLSPWNVCQTMEKGKPSVRASASPNGAKPCNQLLGWKLHNNGPKENDPTEVALVWQLYDQ